MTPDFNFIARLYYPLSRLVFGSSQIRAQEAFLHLVLPQNRILVVGGGNGHFLRYFGKPHTNTPEFFFIEPAPDMMTMAREEAPSSLHIHFIQTTVEQFLSSSKLNFDVVITPFFFDLFPQSKADSLFSTINANLKPGGLWLDTDFQLVSGSIWWQAVLLKMMYAFFRKISNVKASALPDMMTHWQAKYKLSDSRIFYGGFIITRVWQKNMREEASIFNKDC